MIKHVSFDLWMTLIRSNPDFRRKRAELIVEKFNPENRTAEEIIQLIINEDKVFDRYNETEDTKIPAIKMYSTVLEQMGISESDAKDNAEYLMNMSNELFLEYPPVLLNNRISDTLATLKSAGLTLSIGSNTGFAEGNLLRTVLRKSDILKYFSFAVFSDEVKTSKPSIRFFQQIWENTNLLKSQILHIGDNLINDYQGAVNFGFDALLITDKNYSFDDIRAKL